MNVCKHIYVLYVYVHVCWVRPQHTHSLSDTDSQGRSGRPQLGVQGWGAGSHWVDNGLALDQQGLEQVGTSHNQQRLDQDFISSSNGIAVH